MNSFTCKSLNIVILWHIANQNTDWEYGGGYSPTCTEGTPHATDKSMKNTGSVSGTEIIHVSMACHVFGLHSYAKVGEYKKL